jgi:hypothetical protein
MNTWVIGGRIVWHRHSCLCESILREDASTGKSAGATQAWSFQRFNLPSAGAWLGMTILVRRTQLQAEWKGKSCEAIEKTRPKTLARRADFDLNKIANISFPPRAFLSAR